MKLLHITATHLKPDGGVPVVLKELVTEQNKINNFESRVISVVASVEEMHSPYFEYVPRKKFKSYLIEFNPDIVILHSFYYLEYNWVIRQLESRQVKYYIEPHGSFGKTAMKKSWIKKGIANNTILKKQIKFATGFIFLNEAEKEDSVYRTSNDMVIPNGISKNDTAIERNEISDRTIYFIGRYDINHKGLDYLFDALDLLELEGYACRVMMWGKGNKHSEKYILHRIRKYRTVKVEMNNSIYGDKKNTQLEQSGPMILTSRYEGFPMTILEAWKYGNPCIVTPGTNMSREIKDNNLGWVTDVNPNNIARCIKSAIVDYSLQRDYYINNCKHYVFENYNWKNIANISFDKLSRI